MNRIVTLLVLLTVALLSPSAHAEEGTSITVTTPADYSAESKTDSSGEKRLAILGGGGFIEFYNENRFDTLAIVRDGNIISPEVRTCNPSSNLVSQCVRSYTCPGGGCDCATTQQQNVTLSTISPGECVTSNSQNCTSVTLSSCPNP